MKTLILLSLLLFKTNSFATTCAFHMQDVRFFKYSVEEKAAWISAFDRLEQTNPGFRNTAAAFDEVKRLAKDLSPKDPQDFYGLLHKILGGYKYINTVRWIGAQDSMLLFVVNGLEVQQVGIEGNVTYRFLKFFRENISRPEVLEETYRPAALISNKQQWMTDATHILNRIKGLSANSFLDYSEQQNLFELMTPFFYRVDKVKWLLKNILGIQLVVQLPILNAKDPASLAGLTAASLLEKRASNSQGIEKNAMVVLLEALLETDLDTQSVETLYRN